MSNPNLAAMASFYLDDVHGSVGSSATATFLANAAASGEVYEVYSGIFSCIDASTPVTFTLTKHSASGAVEIANLITISPNKAEALIQKNWPIVLKEGECLSRKAGVGGDSAFVIAYRRYA